MLSGTCRRFSRRAWTTGNRVLFAFLLLLSPSFLEEVIAGTPAAVLDHEVALELNTMNALKMQNGKMRAWGPQDHFKSPVLFFCSYVTEASFCLTEITAILWFFCYVWPNFISTNQEISSPLPSKGPQVNVSGFPLTVTYSKLADHFSIIKWLRITLFEGDLFD